MQETNKEEWLSWFDLPVTQEVFRKVRERREEVIQKLAYGGVTDPKQQDIALGAIGAYTHLLEISYED